MIEIVEKIQDTSGIILIVMIIIAILDYDDAITNNSPTAEFSLAFILISSAAAYVMTAIIGVWLK